MRGERLKYWHAPQRHPSAGRNPATGSSSRGAGASEWLSLRGVRGGSVGAGVVEARERVTRGRLGDGGRSPLVWVGVKCLNLSVWGVAEGGLCLGVLQKELVSEADAGASAQVLTS